MASTTPPNGQICISPRIVSIGSGKASRRYAKKRSHAGRTGFLTRLSRWTANARDFFLDVDLQFWTGLEAPSYVETLYVFVLELADDD